MKYVLDRIDFFFDGKLSFELPGNDVVEFVPERDVTYHGCYLDGSHGRIVVSKRPDESDPRGYYLRIEDEAGYEINLHLGL